jgi:DTW domain-containing protein YfiP
LVADVVAETFAFGWSRTATDAALPALLNDPQWQPYVVFPKEYAALDRVVHTVEATIQATVEAPGRFPGGIDRRPLFILLDATWSQARKMFRKSPYLDALPVLDLQADPVSPYQATPYRLRRSRRDDHFCTSQVAAQCLALAGEHLAAQTLDAYLEVFSHHYLQARRQLPVAWDSAAHRRLRELSAPRAGVEASISR